MLNSVSSGLPRAFTARLTTLATDCVWARFQDHQLDRVGEDAHPFTPDELGAALKRSKALATDPAHGGKILPGNVEEASVALMGEHLGVLDQPQRESTGGAEFVDAQGVNWDVKSPLSDDHWEFSPNHQLDKLRHDFGQGDRVLLNLSRCNHNDATNLIGLLNQELNSAERGEVMLLVHQGDIQS